MWFKQKPKWDKPFPEKIAKRVAKIPTADLASWADQSLFELGRCLNMYEKTREIYYLNEALMGVESANAVISELHKRAVL